MKTIALTLALMAGSLTADSVIPVYDLSGSVTEGGNIEASFLSFDADPSRPLTHYDLVKSLEKAAKDEKVPAVVLEVDQASFSLAQMEEIRRVLLRVRAAGKSVHLYSDGLDMKTALLGSAASDFAFNPEGDVSLSGLYAESMYFKGLLDKVGVVADVVHIGDFKSAGENFYRTGPSEAAKLQEEELFDSLHNTIMTEIAVGRAITRDSLARLMDQGFVTAEEALAMRLVDRLEYRTDFVDDLEERYGEASFDKAYVRDGTKQPEVKGMLDVMKMMFSSGKKKTPKVDYIGVVVLDAGITFDSIVPVRDEILSLTDDDHCQALVLRVNSPGGSALASEILWEATDEFTRTGRPFIVSMGAVAASGGYYIASGADEIYAEPGTITGSIGVVGMKLAIGDALEKIGITTHEMKRGNHADLYNTTRPFNEDERTLVRDAMLDVYGTFKQRIIDGRGDKLTKDLEMLAGGRVYTGLEALRLGLVDHLGGLGEAIARAEELSDMTEPKSILLPEPVSPLDTLFNNAHKRNSDEFITMQSSKTAHPVDRLLTAPLLEVLPAAQAHQVKRSLQTLRDLQRDRVQLLAPPIPNF